MTRGRSAEAAALLCTVAALGGVAAGGPPEVAAALAGLAAGLLLCRAVAPRPVPEEPGGWACCLAESRAIAVVGVDRGGVVTRWSEGATTLFGLAAASALGRPLEEVAFAEAEAEGWRAERERLFAGRCDAPVRVREFRLASGPVRKLPCAFCTAGGEEAALLILPGEPDPAERYLELLATSPAALLALGPGGRVVAAAGATRSLTGRESATLEGLSVDTLDFVPGALRARLGAGVREPFESGFDVVFPDGRTRPVTLLAAPSGEGGASVVLVDGAARQRLEAGKREAEEAAAAYRGAAGPSAARARSALAGGRDATGSPRVLLVEDNDDNRALLTHMLRSRGARVTAAASGAEALDAAENGSFELALVDLQMPEMDGFEVAHRLRALPSGGGFPLVALTALTAPGVRERCLTTGFDDFVAKPVSLRRMGELLERWGGRG